MRFAHHHTPPQELGMPIAFGCVKPTNDDVHSDSTKFREAKEEHYYTDEGEEICCPVCGTAWLIDIEGDVASDSCEYLRFSLHSECDDFEFF
jgi:hypothetical protein